jgi:hypothetical protein
MTQFKCLRCGYYDNLKTNVKKHLQRKNICKPIICDVSTRDCLKYLSDNDKDVVINLYEQEILRLKKENEEIRNTQYSVKDSQQVMTGSNNSNNFNTNIHIHVNSFDKTDYTVIKDKIHTCIKDGKVDEAKLIKLLHFNKEHPENHNVKIENKRENRIKVFNGTDFEESDYTGKEGIFKFSQDTLNKTGNQEYIEEDDKTFTAIENTKDENSGLNRNEKSQKIGKLSKVIYNGITS